MNTVATRRLWRAVVACLCLASSIAVSQENKSVLGPKNEDLHAGAEALLAGDAEEGVRRTLIGLKYSSSPRNRAAGLSNLCAGYAMLEKPEEALPWCSEAIELNDRHWRAYSNRALVYIQLGHLEEAEQDLQMAEELAPRSRTVKTVRSMLLDATDPVAPIVVIDDRRQEPDDDEAQ